jgi:adenylate cyclase
MAEARSQTTFELYTLQGSRWEIHARYTAAQREECLKEAKALDKMPGISAVKVIKEVYRPEDGTSDELTIYKSPHLKPAPTGPSRPPSAKSPPRRATAKRGDERRVARPAPAAKSTPLARADSEPAFVPGSAWGVLPRLLLIVLFSIALASLATGLGSLFVREMTIFGARVGRDAYASVLFGIFVVTFLVSAVTLAIIFLSKVQLPETTEEEEEGAEAMSDAAVAANLGTPVAVGERAWSVPNLTTVEAPPPVPVPSAMIEGAADATGTPLRKSPPKAQAAASTPVPAEQELAPLSEYAEQQKMTIMRFLGEGLEAIHAKRPQLESFHKFGLNLFLAGACDLLSRQAKLERETTVRIIGACVQVLGAPTAQAQSFAEKHEEYLLADQRYLQMFQSGCEAMASYLGGNREAAQRMASVLDNWSRPRPRPRDEPRPGPVAVMFTDIVGSTDIAQAKGDTAVQAIVHAHNDIVRAALARFEGKEIKHTGDGIMASFVVPSNALGAARQIQQEVRARNQTFPETPLHLRVGINAGEPIVEGNDLYGLTVHMAARLCALCGPDQVMVSDVVKGLATGKDVRLANRGPQTLKGFKDPVTVFELIWDPNAPPDPGETGEPAPRPTALTSAAAASQPSPLVRPPRPTGSEIAAAPAPTPLPAAAQTTPSSPVAGETAAEVPAVPPPTPAPAVSEQDEDLETEPEQPEAATAERLADEPGPDTRPTAPAAVPGSADVPASPPGKVAT